MGIRVWVQLDCVPEFGLRPFPVPIRHANPSQSRMCLIEVWVQIDGPLRSHLRRLIGFVSRHLAHVGECDVAARDMRIGVCERWIFFDGFMKITNSCSRCFRSSFALKEDTLKIGYVHFR